MPTPFSTLTLNAKTLANLDSLGYTTMTPIQAESLPIILERKDVIAKAKTGSGKTAAFGIGVLEHLDVKCFEIQSLILCPTRELADQVAKEIRRLARFTHNVKVLLLSGGMPFGPERASLGHGAHIIVGTPGRVQDHLGKGTLRLDRLDTLVLDEADRMLDMGFLDAILKIISNVPTTRQTLLFSATFPDSIMSLSRKVQHDAISVAAEALHGDESIETHLLEVAADAKQDALTDLLLHYRPQSSIVFCNTKADCQEVAEALVEDGVHALALHGDLEQDERTSVLIRFANQSCPVLVATDVAARGLDIEDVTAVINYDMPHDPEVYVHRIGRTGRAGKAGLALSLCTASERKKIKALERFLDRELKRETFSTFRGSSGAPLLGTMKTLMVYGGKKEKVRPGDLLGALSAADCIDGKAVGKIDLFRTRAFVAIERTVADRALECLQTGKIKGRKFKVEMID
jgi:ATP-independent RNA helicase DbpA